MKKSIGTISLSYSVALISMTGLFFILGCSDASKQVSDTSKQEDAAQQVASSKQLNAPVPFESSLAMVISAKIDGVWNEIGETPGKVRIPKCEEISVFPSDLCIGNCVEYQKELSRLRVSGITLPNKPTSQSLRIYRDCKLLDGITSLSVSYQTGAWRQCANITDISALSGLKNLTSLNLSYSSNFKFCTYFKRFRDG